MTDDKRMIVKMQLPLETNAVEPLALAYDKGKDYLIHLRVTDKLKAKMARRPKAFFYAEIVDDELQLLEEAPWQTW